MNFDVSGFLSLIPPALTIVLALVTRRVLPSLLCGIVAGNFLLASDAPWRTPFLAIDQMISVASDRDNLILIAFSVLMGGLISLIRVGRGFHAFAGAIEKLVGALTKRSVYAVTTVIGASLFLEVWSNVLVNGSASGSLYDRLKIARVRLAYFTHTLSICIVSIFVINSWGAYYMGLLQAQGVEEPFSFVLGSVPYMFYSWVSLGLVFIVMGTGLALGGMRRFDMAALEGGGAEAAARKQGGEEVEMQYTTVTPRLIYMIGPLITLVAAVFVSLIATGQGDIIAGDGGLSILYAVISASVVAGALLLLYGDVNLVDVEKTFVGGVSNFFDVALLIIFALTLGQLAKDLGTGAYIAQFVGGAFPGFSLPALVFLLGAIMSFATGTSYGTFAIMVPIALPLAVSTGVNPMLMFGAVISGGIFGDNTSPISDTTIMTSIGSRVAVVDHVRTQLPYALIAGVCGLLAFLAMGFVQR